jgi:phosphohistidine phosphatase
VQLLLIRHAAAVARGTSGVADDDRPLTPKGRKRFQAAAAGLRRIVDRPDLLLTSPLPRARATAEIAARAFGRIEPRTEPALAGDSVSRIMAVLGKVAESELVAVVGHEPLLSGLLADLLGSREAGRLEFKKGGAALVDLPRGPVAGGNLIWFVKPRILRTLGED